MMITRSNLALFALSLVVAGCGFNDGPTILGTDSLAESPDSENQSSDDPQDSLATDLSIFDETDEAGQTSGARGGGGAFEEDPQRFAWVKITWDGAPAATAVNLDLHVINALGDEIFFLNTGAGEDGTFLPHDECTSYDCSGDEQAPREQIVWAIEHLVPGHYQAWVANASDPAATFQLQIQAGGHRVDESVSVNGHTNSQLFEWQVPAVPEAEVADPVDAVAARENPDAVHRADYSAEMTWVTANIGRNYTNRSQVRAALDRVGDGVKGKPGPRFIGWQEIGEADPCGGCEIDEINARFASSANWATYRPRGTRPDGATEKVKVPISSRGANTDVVRRVNFASPGWTGVSPTRFVTTTYHPSRNVSIINTHLIAGAWSCKSNVEKRRDYWRRGWRTLKRAVEREHDKGRNVIVTGDLNRPRAVNRCNPQWDPESLHPAARVVGGVGIDYIFAVPAPTQRFKMSKRADGTAKRGAITLGIDGHKAHWIVGRFVKR